MYRQTNKRSSGPSVNTPIARPTDVYAIPADIYNAGGPMLTQKLTEMFVALLNSHYLKSSRMHW